MTNPLMAERREMKDKGKLKFGRVCISCENYPKKCRHGTIEPNCCVDYKPRTEERKDKKINFEVLK